MKDYEVEDSDRDILGKTAVKDECLNGPMQYVFIHGISSNFSEEDKAMYQCRVLNTGEIVFAYRENLIFEPNWHEVERSRIRFELKKTEDRRKYLVSELDSKVRP